MELKLYNTLTRSKEPFRPLDPKNLANKGRTVITTIHQPRSEIWELFDSLVETNGEAPADWMSLLLQQAA